MLVRTLFLSSSLALAIAATPAAATVGTEITYQGRLTDAGEPAAGPHDLAFRLYDAEVGGTQIGPELTAPAFADFGVDGTFSVGLDFGSVFDGNARWLEIDVDHVALTPRQILSAAPYALYALSGNEGPWDLNGPHAYYTGGRVGVGTDLPQAELHVRTASAGVAPNSSATAIVESSGKHYLNMLGPTDREMGILFGNPALGSAAAGIVFNPVAVQDGLDFRTGGNVRQMSITQDGEVRFLRDGTKPAWAWGSIGSNGFVRSASPNIISVAHPQAGFYNITLDGVYNDVDYMVLVTAVDLNPRLVTTTALAGKLRVNVYTVDALGVDSGFHFVVYKR